MRIRKGPWLMAATAFVALIGCSSDTTTPSGSGASVLPSGRSSLAAGDEPVGTEISIDLAELNDSGVGGTARLAQSAAGEVTVTVSLQGAGAGPEPMHIHPGTCASLDPKPAYPLTSVTNGTSSTRVDVGLGTLLAGSFAINVHKSPEEATVYVACGNVTR